MFGPCCRINDCGLLPRPHPYRPQALFVHDGPDRTRSGRDALVTQNRGDLVPPCHALLPLKHPAHVLGELFIAELRRGRFLWFAPAVIRGPGNLQLLAHPVNFVVCLLLPNKRIVVVYRCFAAKKALTFPRNSISRFSSALSACNALYFAHSTGPGSAAAASGCSSYQALTQFPNVPSLTPISFAT